MISGVHWLEPLLPSPVGQSLLLKAQQVFDQADHLKKTAAALQVQVQGHAAHVRVINSYFSNLIEGIDSDFENLGHYVAWDRNKSPLTPAEAHIRAQAQFEKIEVFSPSANLSFADAFSPQLITSLHQHLFEPVCASERTLASGDTVVPGQSRSQSQRQVAVGRHEAPCWSAVDAMLRRMQQAYGAQHDSRQQLIACLAFHHRLAYVHPFDDGNGRVGRLLLHLQLQRIGLEPSLWSISKALYESRERYYAALAGADQPRRGDLDGRGQLTQAGLVSFIEFMLDVVLSCMQEI